MLANGLVKYLSESTGNTNVMIYSKGEVRQLLLSDLDINSDGNIVIDADYEVNAKKVTIDDKTRAF